MTSLGRRGERLQYSAEHQLEMSMASELALKQSLILDDFNTLSYIVLLVMCSISTNGERASLANLKLTIGSLLEYS